MLPKINTNIQMSSNLKETVTRECDESGLNSPLPSILWGNDGGNSEEYFMLGLYERNLVPSDEPIRIIEIEGMEFLIIQDWICDELEGKILDIENGKLIVQE